MIHFSDLFVIAGIKNTGMKCKKREAVKKGIKIITVSINLKGSFFKDVCHSSNILKKY